MIDAAFSLVSLAMEALSMLLYGRALLSGMPPIVAIDHATWDFVTSWYFYVAKDWKCCTRIKKLQAPVVIPTHKKIAIAARQEPLDVKRQCRYEAYG
jgi:hypothetical protein